MKRKIIDVTSSVDGLGIKNVLELPNEILKEILGYLSTQDILRNVAQVSKKFRNLTQDQFLIRKIQVDIKSWYKGTKSLPKTLSEEEVEKYCNDLLEVCKWSRKLTFLSLNFGGMKAKELCLNSKYLTENILKYLRLLQCPSLKVLKFDFLYPSMPKYSLISKFINDFEHENLEKLHFIGHLEMDLGSSTFKKFLETIVGKFPKLQYLYLSLYCCRLTSEAHEICQTFASEKKIKIATSRSLWFKQTIWVNLKNCIIFISDFFFQE